MVWISLIENWGGGDADVYINSCPAAVPVMSCHRTMKGRLCIAMHNPGNECDHHHDGGGCP